MPIINILFNWFESVQYWNRIKINGHQTKQSTSQPIKDPSNVHTPRMSLHFGNCVFLKQLFSCFLNLDAKHNCHVISCQEKCTHYVCLVRYGWCGWFASLYYSQSVWIGFGFCICVFLTCAFLFLNADKVDKRKGLGKTSAHSTHTHSHNACV